MTEQQDVVELKWVSSEIKGALSEIKDSLEKHLEKPINNKALIFCQARLHQVQGSLKMLPEKKGAPLLASELLGVTDSLLNNQAANAQLAIETLIQGITQFSIYIERLQKAENDFPPGFKNLLDALRSIRRQPKLTDLDFFQPTINNKIPPIDDKQIKQLLDSGALKLLRKIRQKYQICLASYLRGQEADNSLDLMNRLLGKLQNLCWGSPSSPLWEAGAALIEGLIDQSIAQSNTSNNLLKELDHQLKLLIDSKGLDINQSPGEGILKRLLFQIASADSDSNLIKAQKQRYQLKSALSFIVTEEAVDTDKKEPPTEAIKTDTEHNPIALDDIHKVALLEARTDVSNASAAINDFAKSKGNSEYLSKIPGLLNSAARTLDMQPLTKCSASIRQLAQDTEQLLIHTHSESDKNTSAFLEHQLEAVQKTLSHIEKACLCFYGGTPVEAEQALSQAQQLSASLTVSTKKTEDKSADLVNTTDLTFDYSKPELIEPYQKTPSEAHIKAAENKVHSYKAGDRNHELIDNFVQTATSIQQTLLGKFDLWQKAPKNIDALKVICRSFNTLKNSARASEASVIGELASAVENMLNRLLERHIKASGNMFSLVKSVTKMLPELINDFKLNNQLLTAEVLLFMEQADDLARGEAFFDPEELKDIQSIESEIPDTEVQLPVGNDIQDQEPSARKEPSARVEPSANSAQAGLSALTNDINILLNADAYLESWEKAIQPQGLSLFKKELKQLATLSSSQNLTPLSLLCDVLLDVCQYLDSHEKYLPEILITPLQEGFESLVDMINQAAAKQPVETPHSTFNLIRLSLESLLKQKNQNTIKANAQNGTLGANPKPTADKKRSTQTQFKASRNESHKSKQKSNNHTFEEIVLTASEEKKSHFVVTEIPEEKHVPQQEFELISTFLEEASDISENCAKALENWLRHDHSIKPVVELQRNLHTLKGGARTVGFQGLGDLSHALESVYESISSGQKEASQTPLGLLQQAHDLLDIMLQAICQKRPLPCALELINKLENWCNPPKKTHSRSNPSNDRKELAATAKLQTDTPRQQPPSGQLPDYLKPSGNAQTSATLTAQATSTGSDTGHQTSSSKAAKISSLVDASPIFSPSLVNEKIRISQELVEQLCNLSAESTIHRSQMEHQITDLKQSLTEIDSTIQRLDDQLRRLDIETSSQITSYHQGLSETNPDFDPLEMDQYSELTQLSNALSESTSDLADLSEAIQEKTKNTEALLLQQSRDQAEFQSQLSQISTVPFNRLLPRLSRTVEKTSAELDIPVDFNIANSQVKIDRVTLDKIQSPLEHLLRNAISHGIEKNTQDRVRENKPAKGQVLLTLTQEASQITLEVADDGQGIDLEAVYNKALEKQLILKDTRPGDSELLQLIVKPGFSTAKTLTQVSGRGVGLDIVNSEIEKLGGNLRIESQLGKGSRFIIRFPIKSSVTRALMVKQGKYSYALPLHAIDGLATISAAKLVDCYTKEKAFEHLGIRHKVISFAQLLNRPPEKLKSDPCPVVIIQRGGENLALQVDAVYGNQEVINKPLGRQFQDLAGVSGATILGDGSIAIIVDPAALIKKHNTLLSHNSKNNHLSKLSPEAVLEITSETEKAIQVLVVDDSVTMRKVTTQLLLRQGYEVLSARDGVEAMSILSEKKPDLVLLDIEMPKMDGFEVVSAVRNNSALCQLPIIMVTSRTTEKHRKKAFSLGANGYISKPFQEESLIKAIKEMIKQSEVNA